MLVNKPQLSTLKIEKSLYFFEEMRKRAWNRKIVMDKMFWQLFIFT